VCHDLACWLWAGFSGLPPDGPETALAADLWRVPAPPGSDWRAQAIAAARKMVKRCLREQLCQCREDLGMAGTQSHRDELIREIERISRALAVEDEATRNARWPTVAAWEAAHTGGPAHYFATGCWRSRCWVRRPSWPEPAAPITTPCCKRCVRLLALDLMRSATTDPTQQRGAS
jgi:hypothetical protein